MDYRRLGRSGLQVSVLSFGSWVTFGTSSTPTRRGNASAPRDAGVNFFDNAEAYAGGQVGAHHGPGARQARLAAPSYVISTKVFWGIGDGAEHEEHAQPQVPPAGDRRVAERLRLDFVDLSSATGPTRTRRSRRRCGRCATSSRRARRSTGAPRSGARPRSGPPGIAERHHLHKPVVEQPQYNLFQRDKVEQRVRAALRRHRPRHSPPGARSPRAC